MLAYHIEFNLVVLGQRQTCTDQPEMGRLIVTRLSAFQVTQGHRNWHDRSGT